MVKRRRTSTEQEEKYQRLTREALADVDAGRVLDHRVVLAWAESLDASEPLPASRGATN